jgi:hypothetical protein
MNVVAFLIIFTLGSFAGAIGVGTVWAARRVRSHERSANASPPAPAADEPAADVPPAHRKFIFAVLRDLNTGQRRRGHDHGRLRRRRPHQTVPGADRHRGADEAGAHPRRHARRAHHHQPSFSGGSL